MELLNNFGSTGGDSNLLVKWRNSIDCENEIHMGLLSTISGAKLPVVEEVFHANHQKDEYYCMTRVSAANSNNSRKKKNLKQLIVHVLGEISGNLDRFQV